VGNQGIGFENKPIQTGFEQIVPACYGMRQIYPLKKNFFSGLFVLVRQAGICMWGM